jgi:hypothetical protein
VRVLNGAPALAACHLLETLAAAVVKTRSPVMKTSTQ